MLQHVAPCMSVLSKYCRFFFILTFIFYTYVKVCIRIERVGCYRDERPFRALRNFYYTGRKYINWTTEPWNTTAIVRRCAENAYKQGYKTLFGIQYYGECWSDGFAEERYNKYGVSSNCEHGVGKNWANMVYRLSG
jgi:hypothetical protein